ncbi:MAG TPA: phospholipid carrier-dependent glycosyltransferase, partial [Candidatus Saccharimonadales bacterium]|nr:phospholipid carrier-dependent glycosyltransferase [Candidatus Saccharimonadales bacterium]
ITHLLVTDDEESLLAASEATVTALDGATGEPTGSMDLPSIADLAAAGTGDVLTTTRAALDDPDAVLARLVELTEGTTAEFQARLAAAPTDESRVILGSPGTGEARKAVDQALTDGELPGVEIQDLPRVAVATEDGVTFIDPTTAGSSSAIAIDGGAHGLALVTGIDDPRLYVTSGSADDPGYEVLTVGGDSAEGGPVSSGNHPLPAAGTRVAYDEASQHVHILGRAPPTGATAGDGWTVYVVEPHANAVYADALLPPGLVPAAWAVDVEARYAVDDRQQLLVFGSDGMSASIELGSHAFAWRLPGVIAGALMAGCLYLLARILFQRRLVAGLVAAFVLLDGMFFVQSRIGMNDVYVGLFIVAAYTAFAAVWTGWWRGRGAFWLAMPLVGVLLGLALASKWVAAYAIGALLLLLLIRSALGRVLAILGLIAITTVLGYLAISVPEGQGFGNLTFLLIMIALTLIAVVVAIMHPIAWTDEEQWFALLAPTALGALVFFGALTLGQLDRSIALGPIELTPLLAAIALASASVVVYVLFQVAGRIGFGPLAVPPGPADPARLLEPPAPPPDGWLRPGWLAGVPVVWALACLVALPLVVYVISYIPWAVIENHQLWAGVPEGHTGQTLLELTAQMYGYHNGLTSPHPASSPWWAWPLDLKPVWFYQDSFANDTSAAIYDAGNLVIWWIGVPAMIFASIMAYRRRSLALALITIGFAAQWISWARIDRAAFQYHYYTALPFVILALAYLTAELWHGASRRTWMWARIAAALAIVGPALMWLLSRPLCAFVGVESVNPGSQACPAVIPEAVITVRTIGLLLVVGVGAYVLGRAVLALDRSDDRRSGPMDAGFRRVIVSAVGVAIGFAVVALLPDTEIMTLTGIPVEPIALIIAIPLSYLAAQVIAARDAHRFVLGLGIAVMAWFVVWYPNISALPLPSALVNAYQGLLPTYLYAFQFPVRAGERAVDAPLFSPTVLILGAAVTVTCLVVAYSAWTWRLALAESRAAAIDGSAGDDATSEGLARTGGGA